MTSKQDDKHTQIDIVPMKGLSRKALLQKEGHTKEHSFNFFFHIVAFRVNLNHELFYDSLKEIIRAPINHYSQNMLVCPICKLKRILISQETKFVIS